MKKDRNIKEPIKLSLNMGIALSIFLIVLGAISIFGFGIDNSFKKSINAQNPENSKITVSQSENSIT
ncbi:MAG: hypothetical protein HFJ45_06460 [Clostridia bacterium]|nr:hypothetical protein [Clostridia bacterium]